MRGETFKDESETADLGQPKWNENQTVLAAAIHTLDRDVEPLKGAAAGSWSLRIVDQFQGEDCLVLIPFRLPQISCYPLSLKCFSSDSDNCPDVGIRPLLQFPHPLRTGPVLLTLLFFPLVPSS